MENTDLGNQEIRVCMYFDEKVLKLTNFINILLVGLSFNKELVQNTFIAMEYK